MVRVDCHDWLGKRGYWREKNREGKGMRDEGSGMKSELSMVKG